MCMVEIVLYKVYHYYIKRSSGCQGKRVMRNGRSNKYYVVRNLCCLTTNASCLRFGSGVSRGDITFPFLQPSLHRLVLFGIEVAIEPVAAGAFILAAAAVSRFGAATSAFFAALFFTPRSLRASAADAADALPFRTGITRNERIVGRLTTGRVSRLTQSNSASVSGGPELVGKTIPRCMPKRGRWVGRWGAFGEGEGHTHT